MTLRVVPDKYIVSLFPWSIIQAPRLSGEIERTYSTHHRPSQSPACVHAPLVACRTGKQIELKSYLIGYGSVRWRWMLWNQYHYKSFFSSKLIPHFQCRIANGFYQRKILEIVYYRTEIRDLKVTNVDPNVTTNTESRDAWFLSVFATL